MWNFFCPRLSACVRILVRTCPQVSACVRKKCGCPHPVRNSARYFDTRYLCIDNSAVVSSSGTTAAAERSGLQCQQRSNSKTAIVKLTTMNHFALHDRRPRKRNGTQDQQKIATAAAAQQRRWRQQRERPTTLFDAPSLAATRHKGTARDFVVRGGFVLSLPTLELLFDGSYDEEYIVEDHADEI
jgi:hypothetical protein